MQTPLDRLSALNRPRLLVRAARIGLADYNREHTLRRLLPGHAVPAPGKAIEVLLDREEALDTIRREGGASYSSARHVEMLAALINEGRLAGNRDAA